MTTTKKYIAGPAFKSGSDNRTRRPVLGGNGTYLVEAEADMSVWTFIDDKEAWEQANREHRAEQIDASDEERLAAGWVQQACSLGQRDRMEGDLLVAGLLFAGSGCSLGRRDRMEGDPAPGVAGKWRLHASGFWMRWVRS